MTQPGYVFVVGSGRSGTTLVRLILNMSPDAAISGETRFLKDGPFRRGFWHDFARAGDISTPGGARKVVDYIYDDLNRRSFWDWIRQNVDRNDFLQRLLESDRTGRALLDVALACYAGDKPVRGEKTPAHIYSMPTLLEWFPDGKFIHMMRDPRAVLASTKSARTRTEGRHVWRPESLVSVWVGAAVLKSWRDCAHLHHRYQQDYPHNYIMVRFEDLIVDPQAWVPKLCEFVGIGFVQDMFSPEVVNSSFVSRAAHVQGFDSAALERWREHLHPLFDRWYGAVLRRELLEFGYQP